MKWTYYKFNDWLLRTNGDTYQHFNGKHWELDSYITQRLIEGNPHMVKKITEEEAFLEMV